MNVSIKKYRNKLTDILRRDPLGWDIFNVVNFENCIYLKLYSLLNWKYEKVKKQL